MLDRDIRPQLIRSIHEDDPSALVFQELPIFRGQVLADIASANGSLCGFEIKSEQDSLARLKRQVSGYDAIFDYSLLVTTEKHLRIARGMIPPKWGIKLAKTVPDGISLEHVRKARRNTTPDSVALLRLLWRNELAKVLRHEGCRFEANALIADLWNIAAREVPPRKIRDAVREQLKLRKAALQPGQYDG